MRILMGSLIVLDYHGPSTKGSILINSIVYLEATPIGSGFAWISVVNDPLIEPQTPTGLSATYHAVDSGSTWQPLTHILITVRRDGQILHNINYIQINDIADVYVEQGPAYDNTTLHLMAKHPLDFEGPVQILIWDEFGTSEIIDIYFDRTSNINDESTTDGTGGKKDINDETEWYLPGAIIGTVSMVLILLVISAALWDRMRNPVITQPTENNDR